MLNVTERFLRPTDSCGNAYDVYIRGSKRGTVTFNGGYYEAVGFDPYGEPESVGEYPTRGWAARVVAEYAEGVDEWQAAEAEGEMRAEFIMSWVCGGGHPDDAGIAYMMQRESI